MKTKKTNLAARALVIAIQAALLTLGTVATAHAQDDEDDTVRQLTLPTDSVDVGIGYVSQDSFKFGEYNGLENKGAHVILNFVLSGGGHFDSDSAVRWRITATNLGLNSREIKAEYGEQGHFRLSFDYDQLRRNRSDSYQTPYLGAGGTVLTLPANWQPPHVPQISSTGVNFRSLDPDVSQVPVLVGGVLTAPTPAQLAQLQAIADNDRAAFHHVDLHTQREKTQIGFTYQINSQWDLKLSAQNEHKEGLKPMSTVSSQVSEFAAVIPDRIDQDTQQYVASVNYTADRSYMQMGYYGSVYDNHVDSMTWQDVNDPTKSATMSSAPSNQFHQFNVLGGYNFSPRTKLVVNASYGRNTQNDTYLVNPQLPLGVPVNSLDGKVVTETFDARLTSRPVDRLNLNFAYKYDNHDNRTPVNIYIFQDANEARSANPSPFNAVLGLAPNTLASNINIYANRPYSKKLNQLDASADYEVATGQNLKFGYQYQEIDRRCNGSWINCADAPKSRENTGLFEWRMNAAENVSANVTYSYSRRTVNYDENAFLALVPMANFIPAGGATVSVLDYLLANGLTGFGPNLGYPLVALTGDAAIFSPNNNIIPQALYGSRNNINELLGLRRYNMADRNRSKLRAKLDWQASDKVSVDASVDYDHDDYTHSLYGLTSARNWALNLEADYDINENVGTYIYYTYENRDSQSAGRAYGSNSSTAFVGDPSNTLVSGGCYATVLEVNSNRKIDECLEWTTDSSDKVHTFGMGFNYRGLRGGKLDLALDIIGTRARTNIGVTGGSYVNNPTASAGPVTPAVFYIPAANFPTVTTNTFELRFDTKWLLDKSSDLRAYYWYSHLTTTDYIYDGMQFGTLTAVMPTLEKPPSYTVNQVGLVYSYHWQ